MFKSVAVIVAQIAILSVRLQHVAGLLEALYVQGWVDGLNERRELIDDLRRESQAAIDRIKVTYDEGPKQ